MKSAHIHLEGYDELQKAVGRIANKKRMGAVMRQTWQKEATTKIKPKMRSHVRGRMGGKRKLASSYSARVFGKMLDDLRMIVYSRLKASIPHEYGPLAPIVAKRHKYLAIPTDFAQKRKGKLKPGAGVRYRKIRPSMLKKGTTFTIKGRGNTKIIMQKVDEELHGAAMRKARGKKFTAKGGAIPMFVLKPRQVLPVRTNIRRLFKYQIRGIINSMLGEIAKEWKHA